MRIFVSTCTMFILVAFSMLAFFTVLCLLSVQCRVKERPKEFFSNVSDFKTHATVTGFVS